MSRYKIFVPINGGITKRKLFFGINHCYKNKQYSFKICKKPFFSLINEDFTPKFFIDAIKENNNDDAIACLSKSLGSNIDLEYVKGFFNSNYSYKYPVEVTGVNVKGHKIRTVMITDNKSRLKGMVHFYMIKEPDSLSNWKIYKIVKE